MEVSNNTANKYRGLNPLPALRPVLAFAESTGDSGLGTGEAHLLKDLKKDVLELFLDAVTQYALFMVEVRQKKNDLFGQALITDALLASENLDYSEEEELQKSQLMFFWGAAKLFGHPFADYVENLGVESTGNFDDIEDKADEAFNSEEFDDFMAKINEAKHEKTIQEVFPNTSEIVQKVKKAPSTLYRVQDLCKVDRSIQKDEDPLLVIYPQTLIRTLFFSKAAQRSWREKWEFYRHLGELTEDPEEWLMKEFAILVELDPQKPPSLEDFEEAIHTKIIMPILVLKARLKAFE